jgi:hypothetical protein
LSKLPVRYPFSVSQFQNSKVKQQLTFFDKPIIVHTRGL